MSWHWYRTAGGIIGNFIPILLRLLFFVGDRDRDSDRDRFVSQFGVRFRKQRFSFC